MVINIYIYIYILITAFDLVILDFELFIYLFGLDCLFVFDGTGASPGSEPQALSR